MSSSRPKSSGRGATRLVVLVHRRVLHEVGRRGVQLALLGEHLGRDRITPDVCPGDDQLADLLGVLHRREERDAATERIADQVRLVEPEVVDERRDVVGHEPDVERAIDVGRPAVTLEIDRDDLVVRGEGGQGRPEHLAREEPAVEQDHRPAAAVHLVVEVDAVDVGVLAGAPGFGRPFRRGHWGLLLPRRTILTPSVHERGS